MEQLNYSQNDLAKVIGLKSRASEILNKKRKLSLEMIRNLHDRMNIPTEVLIQAYWFSQDFGNFFENSWD